MNESDYVVVSDLQRVKTAIQVLSDVIPENSETITKQSHSMVMAELSKWQTGLFSEAHERIRKG